MSRPLPIASPLSRDGAPEAPAAGAEPAWFEGGVRFRCQGPECGRCCSGQRGPGAVWVDEEEIVRLAGHLSLPVEEFSRSYVKRIWGRTSLRERPSFDCVFLDPGRGCTVYEARPTQCRTYPFWGRVMASRVTWELEAEECPGISGDAPVVEADEVRHQLEIEARRPGGAIPGAELPQT